MTATSLSTARERRTESRIPVDLGARISLIEETPDHVPVSFPCRILDITLNGCRLLTHPEHTADVDPTRRLELNVALGASEHCTFNGEIRWTRRREDGRSESGVRFLGSSQAARDRLDAFLQLPQSQRRTRKSGRYLKAAKHRRRVGIALVAASVLLGLALAIAFGAAPSYLRRAKEAAIVHERQLLVDLLRRERETLLKELRSERSVLGFSAGHAELGYPLAPEREHADAFSEHEREELRRLLQDRPAY